MASSRLLRAGAAPLTRRALATALAALPLGGVVEAKKPKRNAQPEHNVRGKKAIMCVNGVTKRVAKRARKKYLKRGATRGACQPNGCAPDSDTATCAAAGICGDVLNNCGQTVSCGCSSSQQCCNGVCVSAIWANQTTFGPGSGSGQFTSPQHIALTTDARTAFITTDDSPHVSVWTRPNATSLNWAPQTQFGALGDFISPDGIALTSDARTALIVDIANERVSAWIRPSAGSTDWIFQTNFGAPGDFSFPRGIALSPDGRTAWISNPSSDRISIWTRSGATTTDWANQTTFGASGSGSGQLDGPFDVAISPDTLTAFVADNLNNRVSVWTRPNATSTTWTNQTTFGADVLVSAVAIAVAADLRTVWVTDGLSSLISVWARPTATSTAWANVASFGANGSGPSQLWDPVGVTVTPDGATAYVADFNNSRVSIWAATCPA
ncbi:MAG: hypothetical protein QM692_16410 [Thermomicrobiales bacterium]